MKRCIRPLLVLLLATLAVPFMESPAGAAPGVPTLLTPANGSSGSVNPVFHWQAAANATQYRIQISAASNFTPTIVNASTVNTYYTPAAELPQGTLYWHVQSIDAQSQTSAYSGTFQYDKTPSVAPNPTSPPDLHEFNYPNDPIVFSWDALAGARTYDIEIALDAAFTAPLVLSANTQVTSYTLTAPQTFGQTYYWRIRSKTQTNQNSQFSSPRRYSTKWTSGPTLVSPPDQQLPAIEEVKLVWNALAGATTYDLQISPDINFNQLTVNANVKGTIYSPNTHLNNGSYFWRVRGKTPQNAIGDWSVARTFSKAWPGSPNPETGPSSRVQLISPADGDLDLRQPTFKWTPFRLGSHYEIQIGPDSNFSPGSFMSCTTNHTEYTPYEGCDPAPGTVYYWRVRPIDDSGNILGLFSPNNGSGQPWRFQYYPAMIQETSPAEGATVTVPILEWEVPSTDIARYRVTVVRAVDSNPVANTTTYDNRYVPSLTYDETTPENNQYEWYVQTVDRNGRLGPLPNQCCWRSFWLGAPGATSPSPTPIGAPGSGTHVPLLQWQPTTGAGKYTIFYAPSGSPVFQTLSSNISTTAYAYPNDAVAAGTYDWYVAAYTSGGALIANGAMSQFTVTHIQSGSGGAVQTAPEHCPPNDNNCTILLDTPTFDWLPVPGAVTYAVMLATDANFTNITKQYTTGYTQLTPRESYTDSQAGQATYWFVRACYGQRCGQGPEVFPPPNNPPISAYRKISKPVTTFGVGDLMPDPQNPPSNPPTVANLPTFTWEDYLTTNQTPPCATPLTPPCVTQEARNYVIQVSQLTDFTTILDQQTVDETTYSPYASTYPEGPLYWRVYARDASNNSLTMSIPRALNKVSPAPTLSSPAHNAPVNAMPVFRWNAQTYASRYEFELYKNPDQPLSSANRVASIQTYLTAWTPTATQPPGTYGWRVRRLDADGRSGPWSAPDNTTLRRIIYTGPATNLTSPADNAVIGNNDLLLQWDTVQNAVSYRVQTSTSSNFSSLKEDVSTYMTSYAPTTAYSDVQGQNIYYWRVQTLDANGQILATSAVRKFTRGIPPLSEPLNVSGTGQNSSALVAWTAPLYNGGSAILDYTVTSSPGNATCTTPGPALSCVVANLSNGTQYTFTVRARNANGQGPPSLPSNPVIPLGVPTAPQNVAAVAGNGQIAVSWTAPSNNGGSAITGYTATAQPGGLSCSTALLDCTIIGLTNGTAYTITVRAQNVQGQGAASNGVEATPTSADWFHALPPARILDSRPAGPQIGPFGTPWSPGATRNVQVTGNGNVPAGADAVLLNVTVVNTTGSSFLTMWPTGQPRPETSSLNWVPGDIRPNSVTVKLSNTGQVSIYNLAGNTDVIIDVSGYYDTNAAGGSGFTSMSPVRIQDSRPAGPQVGPYGTPWQAGVPRDVQVRNIFGVPANADAVVLNATVTNTTAWSNLTVWPAGETQPNASSLNWNTGLTIPNAVTVKVGNNHSISVVSPSGNVDVIFDVVGYFTPGSGKLFHPISPRRFQDSRPPPSQVGPYSTPWTPGLVREIQAANWFGVPGNADSVLANATITNTTASSHLTVWPNGSAQPLASSLNWSQGKTIPNAITVKVGTSGRIRASSPSGNVDVIMDVGGFYA